MGQTTERDIKETLEGKDPRALNWEGLDKVELPTGAISSINRVDDPT